MQHTKEELADKIVELCTENWKKERTPLLLSELGANLKDAGFDYKAILKLQGLRKFIADNAGKLAIVQHPTLFAKIGIIPTAKSFSYTDIPTLSKSEPSELDRLRKNRRAFYGFIEALSELPPEEIAGVSIPARVIVRLLEGK